MCPYFAKCTCRYGDACSKAHTKEKPRSASPKAKGKSKAKAKIKKLLNKYGAYSHMPVQNGMGAPTLDFVCCYGGLYLAIEAKAPGKKPSARQLKTMSQISAAGGVALCVGTNDEQFEALEKLLKALHDKRISFSQAPEAAAAK